ncbi:hypothetical protein FKM82_023799 [Ascaphus truei]
MIKAYLWGTPALLTLYFSLSAGGRSHRVMSGTVSMRAGVGLLGTGVLEATVGCLGGSFPPVVVAGLSPGVVLTGLSCPPQWHTCTLHLLVEGVHLVMEGGRRSHSSHPCHPPALASGKQGH